MKTTPIGFAVFFAFALLPLMAHADRGLRVALHHHKNLEQVAKQHCRSINNDRNMPFYCDMYTDSNGVDVVKTSWKTLPVNMGSLFDGKEKFNWRTVVGNTVENASKVKILEEQVLKPFCNYHKRHGSASNAMIVSGNQSRWCKS